MKTAARSPLSALAKAGLLALCLVVALPAHRAAAQIVDLNTIKKVPRYDTLTDAQFAAQTTAYADPRDGDKALAFTMRLPIGWHRGDADKISDQTPDQTSDQAGTPVAADEANHDLLGKIARFYGSDGFGHQSRIEIDSLRLSYDISLKNWFVNHIVSNGYSLQGLEQVNPTRMEALYVLVEGDQSYIVRTIAQLNGARIATVSYYLPEDNWKTDRALQEKVISSFQFTNPDKSIAEQMHTFAFLDLLHFDYPASWRIDSPDIESPQDMSVTLVDGTITKKSASASGQIDIHIVSTQGPVSLAQQVLDIKSTLAKIGMTTGALIEAPADIAKPKQVYFMRVEVYEAKGNANQYVPQEYWLAVMTENRYYYLISMLAPSRTVNFLSWARDTEAFRKIAQSMRP